MMSKKTWIAKFPGQQPPNKILFSDILKGVGVVALMILMGLAMMIMMVVI